MMRLHQIFGLPTSVQTEWIDKTEVGWGGQLLEGHVQGIYPWDLLRWTYFVNF